MKKFVVIFIMVILFSILLGVLFFKIYPSTPKYSSEDIYALIQKGTETMNNMENVCIERKNSYATCKYYYKGNKLKRLYTGEPGCMGNAENSSVSYDIIDFDQKKQYIVSDKKKMLIIQDENTYIINSNRDKGLQYEIFNFITANQIELSYIKDEIIDQKDCIFVKEMIDTRSGDVSAYWIEKSTGFILGGALIKPTQTSATPLAWIKNITFNEVVDSDFDLPSDYTVYDRSN